MLYNKTDLTKSNDKKVLRKVKKRWVTVSMATFAAAGMSFVASEGTQAHADTKTQSAPSQSGQSQSVGTQPSVTVSDNGQSGTQNSGQGTQTTTTTTTNNNTSTQQSSQFNNVDETAKYSSQIQQGYTDAYQNKGNQSSTMSGQAANYYNAGYAGAQSAMNAYVKNTQGVGAGNQDYNYYGNTVTKQDGYQNDNANANSGTQGSSNKRKTAGDNGNAAKTQTATTTTATNPTDGTPLNSTNPNNINQGGADNPKDASTSVATYESTMLNKVNTANNISVKVTSPTQAINIPTANTDVIVNDRNKYANAIGLRKAFDQGVTYALQQQGISDAESGKWQGVYKGSNGQTKDYYLSSNSNDSNNVYDQAYRGARDAMNAYFNSSNAYQGNTAVQTTTTGTADYQAGFNDVVNQASQGIVYVQNGQQYASVMTGSTTPNTVAGTIANNINTIRLANDVDLTGAINGENDGTVYTNSATITVDGQNHMMDFHGNNYTINRNGTGSLDVYLQNFQTMYGANYFGAFRAEAGAVFHFSNINYVGPQLLSSYSNDTYFSGNVNVLVPTASTYYTSPFQSGILIEGAGNQENLEVNNFILEPNSNYFGNTSPALGGTNVVVTGNFTLGENSKMTLIPRGGNGGAATIADGSTWGVWLKNTGASLNINKNASLNIIPQLYNNQKNLFGGAIYSAAAVSININGGTLNYEGYNGISGYYNQPVDIQGSNQTQINVINGGVMQILMDSVPDVTSWNSYNYHQSTYGGLINNVGQGSFNIGSRGNLKVGVTNSDSTYNVPYFGPININSVGSNHAVFLKTSAVPQFQTTAGTSGQTKSGNINAYTVAIQQANGTKQYLYNFTLNSGSNTYSGIDFNGDNKTGNINGNTLDIADVPAVQFVGPLTKQTNSDGTVTVTGYAKLSNYKELNNQPIFVGVASSNSNPANYNSLTAVPNTKQPDTYSKADPNLYVTTVDTTGYTGGIIPINYTFAQGANTNYIGMRLHYGINSVNSILTPTGYNSTVEGYKDAGNGKVVEDTTNGDMQIANGQLGNLSSGVTDALADSIGSTTANKDAEPFNTKTNSDYLASYSSVQSGYAAFDPSNPNQDYTQLSDYINSANPSAFAQGYREAAYQAGLNDARFNKTNVQGNANYAEAQNQYNQAYQTALNNPGVDVATLIKNNNLPTLTSNGTAATAVTTAISDAQGALAFVQDEQAATINGTNYQAIKNDKAKVNAYNDAETGYNNALSVDHNADNPDTNADKAETAGFEYGQSLINGGLSSSTPTATAPHMNNLQAAIAGYNAAQAAITRAKSTNISIIQRGLKGGSHEKMNTDSYLGDLTAYQSVKYGAYTGLANQSDSSLNSLEKVGYNAVVIPVATQLGQQAFMNKAGNTPTGVAALSDAGKQAFSNAYNQAQTDYNAGQSQGLTDAQANNKTSNVPSNIPSSVINSDAYKLGYKGSVDGYADGSLTSAGTQNAKDTKAQPAYNDAYNAAYALGRQTAGGNDYVQYKQQKATDSDYKNGYVQAQQGHDDGYNDAKTASNPQPTKSSTIPYVTGYKSGVADEQADATQAANDQGYIDGGNDFLNNVTRPTTVAQFPNKSTDYTANYFKAFDATDSGFHDGLSNQDNSSSITDAKQLAAYKAGQDAVKTVTDKMSTNDANESSANNSSNKLESVTNDYFKSVMSGLRGVNYTNAENVNGTLYKEISNKFTEGQTSYNNAITQAYQDKNAKGNNVYSNLAISEYNAGYTNNAQSDTNSKAYVAGATDKTNLNTGVQAAKTSVPQRTLTTQDAAVDGYKAGLSDAFGVTSNSQPSSPSRVWQDAYALAQSDAANDNLKSTALQAVTSGSGQPFANDTVRDVLGQSVYNSMNAGYQGAKNGSQTPAQPNDTNYVLGFSAANKANADFEKAESQNLPVNSSQESDTFNGATDAINNVNQHGTMTPFAPDGVHSQAYINAYNKALTRANTAIAKAFNDMSSGKHADNSTVDTVADKALYDNAYKADVKGYNAGVSGQQFPSNILGQDGYNLGQNATAGYNAAVQKAIYNKDTPNATTLTNYTPSLNGLQDAQANKPAQSSDPAYVYAYSQEKAVQNAINDVQKGTQANKQAPDGTNDEAYNTAYQATVDGYKDGHDNTNANSLNKQSDTRPVYTASYDQGMNAGRVQRGADDYTGNNVNNDVYNHDPYYKKGVDEASHGFYDGKAKVKPASTSPSYQAGYVQGSSAADGIKQAAPSSSNDKGLSSDGLNAYYGVKDAYNDVQNPTSTTKPSDGKGITKNNAYNDAYNNAKADVTQAENNGVKAFASQATQPTSDGSMKQDATVDGYNQAKNGYTAARQGKADPINSNPSYQAGIAMANDVSIGENAANNNNTTANDTQATAAQAYKDAVANVKAGNLDAQPTVSNPAQAQAYKDAYSDALSTAKQTVQNAANDYLSGTQNNSNPSTLQGQLYSNEVQNATDGFNAGTNNTDVKQPNDVAYMTSYKAGQSAAQAVKDQQDGQPDDSKATDKTNYDNSEIGYQDGVTNVLNGQNNAPAQSTPAYVYAFNIAKSDANNAYYQGTQAAVRDPYDNFDGGLVSGNSSLQKLSTNGFNDVKSGFESILTGNPISVSNSATQTGMTLAQTALRVVNQSIAGQPTEDISNDIKKNINGALSIAQQNVKNNPSVDPTVIPSGMNDLQAIAYTKAVTAYEKNYNSGVATAKSLGNEPTETNAKQGYDDFMSGLKSVIVPNAQQITSPNSGQQAGINAKSTYDSAYQDGLAGITNNDKTSNPIYSQANTGATQAITDFAKGTKKTADEINAMPLVEQTAYNNAYNAALNAHQTGADTFVSGQARPQGSQGISTAMATGYDDAKNGYQAAQQGKKFTDLTPDEQNNPSFMTGFNAATQGTSGLADLEQGKQPGNDKNEQDGFNGATAGYNSGVAGQPKPDLSAFSKPYQDAFNKAYDEAHNGSQTGYADAMKPASQATDLSKQTPLFAKAYKTGNDKANTEIAAGVQDFKNNQSQPTGITDANKYGFNQAKAGYNSTPTDNNDDAYKAGADQANALQTAKADVISNTPAKNDVVSEAQNAIVNGINDAIANSNAHANDPANNPRLASDAYKTGITLGNQARNDGANAFINGDTKPANTSYVDSAKVAGYNNASKGFTDGSLANSQPTQPNDADYMKGYNAAQAVQAAEKNAQTPNGQNTAQDTDAFNNATQGYAAAVNALKNNVDNPGTPTNKNVAYTKAYNDAISRLQPEYAQGAKALTDMSDVPATDNTLGKADNDAIQKGYNDSLKAYNAGLNGDTSFTPASNAETTANALGKAAAEGIQNVINDKTPSTGNDIADKALQLAKQFATQGDFSSNIEPVQLGKNPIAQALFTKALSALHNNYNANVAKEIAGQPVDNTTMGTNAKTDADAAIKAGYNGQSNPGKLVNAFNAGQDAKAGFTAAQSTDTIPQGSSNAFTQGFNAAKQALSDVAQGKTTDTSSQPLTYQLAYNAASAQATQVSQNGANGFITGQSRPLGDDNNAKVSQNAYDQAQKGYNEAKAGKADNNNTDPSYQAGVKAYADAQKGIAYAQANKSVPTGSDVTPAEALAAQAVIDGYAGNDEKHPENSLYDGIYKDAQADDSKQQKAGAIDGNSSTPATDVSKLTPLQKASYDKGNNDAQQGYNRAHDVLTADTPTNVSENAQQAQNGAKAAYNDVLNNTQTQLTDKDPVFVASYNKAKADAEKAVADGQKGANTNTPVIDGSSAHDKIAKHANDEYIAGYKGDTVNGNQNDPSFIAGQTEKAKAQAVVDAFKKTPIATDLGLPISAQQGMNEAFMGASSPSSMNDEDAIAKDDVYAQIHKYTADNMNQGASDFITGANPRATGNDLASIAKQKGFDNAQQGFADALAGNIPNPSQPGSIDGANAAKALMALEHDYDTNAKVPSLVTDIASYNAANNGYQAAIKAWKANPEGTLTSDEPNNPVYTRAFNDVANRLTDIKANALKDVLNNNVNANAPTNNDLKAVYDKYVNDAKAAIEHGANNDTSFTPNSSVAINAIFNKLIDANKAIQSVAHDNDNSKDADTANVISNALKAVKQDPINASDNLSNSDPVSQAVYKNAVDAFKAEYKSGVKATIDGNQNVANDTLAKTGATDAIAAIKAGYNGQTNPNGNDDAYKAGQDAKAGYNEAQANKHTDNNVSQSEQNGNQAVFDALSDNASGKQANVSDKPLTYQLAYATATHDATALAQQNANAFVNGDPRPVGDDANTKVAQSAYDKALQGYNDAKSGKADNNNTDTSYQAGVKAYNDALKGAQYAQANKAVPTDGTSAEKLAAQALIDGYKCNDKAHPNNAIYSDFYNQGHNDDVALQAQAAHDAMQTGNKNTDKLTPLQTESYNKGFDKANDGFNSVHDNLNNFTPDNDVNANNAQQGAKAGYQAVLDGKDTDLTDKDPVFVAAYNKAKTDGSNALQQGEAIAKAKGNVTPGNDADSVIKKSAFDNLNAGYQAAMHDDDTSNKNASFQKGVELAGEVKAAIKDYEANPSNNNSDLGKVADIAFHDAIKDNQDNKPANDVNELAKTDVYNAIHQATVDNAIKGANAFIANDKDPMNTDLAGKAFTEGYAQAKNGHDNAANDSTGTQYFNAGRTAAVQGINGAKAFANADKPDDKFTGSTQPETDGYQGALQGYTDAINDKANVAHDDKSTAYNDAYNAAYNNAKNAEHQGALSALGLANTKPATPADKHAYDLGATNVNAAVKNAEQVNHDNDKSLTNVDSKDAFDATVAAINDGQVHKHADISDKSTIYQTAYNNAFNKADKAQTTGLNAALTHQDNPVNAVNNAFDNIENNAFNQAHQAIYDVLDNGVTNVPTNASEATVKGHNVGITMLNGIKNAFAGTQNQEPTNADYTYGYNSAHLGMTDGLAAAQAGKSFANKSDIPVPANVDKDIYQTTVFNMINSYKAGINTNAKPTVNGPVANAANDKGYADGLANSDKLDANALHDYLAGTKRNQFVNDKDQKDYDKQYSDIDAGYNDALNHRGVHGKDLAYQAGYAAGLDVLKGIADGKLAHKNSEYANDHIAYNQAYQGYTDGIRAAKSRKHVDMKNVSPAYVYAYKLALTTETRRQSNLGAKDAIKYVKRHGISRMPLNKDKSSAYRESYREAFIKYSREHAPKWVYNTRTIFAYGSSRFTKGNRSRGFRYTTRSNSHVWYVRGIEFSKTGILRYKVGHGKFITGNENFVTNAYYRHNFKEFRVIKPSGVFMYKSLHFTNKNRILRLRKGQILHVKRIIHIGKADMTRLQLTNGSFVTSNKTFVIKAK